MYLQGSGNAEESDSMDTSISDTCSGNQLILTPDVSESRLNEDSTRIFDLCARTCVVLAALSDNSLMTSSWTPDHADNFRALFGGIGHASTGPGTILSLALGRRLRHTYDH